MSAACESTESASLRKSAFSQVATRGSCHKSAPRVAGLADLASLASLPSLASPVSLTGEAGLPQDLLVSSHAGLDGLAG
jgi:hypothetical protein